MTAHRKGTLLALAASAGAACFLAVYKLAAQFGTPSDAVLLLLSSAAALNSLTSVAESRGQKFLRFDRLSILLSVALAGLTLLGNYFAAEAVARISAPITSVMQQTQLVFVAFFAGLLLGERASPRFWLGTAIAGVGVVILHVSPHQNARLDPLGTTLAAGSAACFGLMSILTRKYILRIRPLAVNALRLWISVALWFAVERRIPIATWNYQFVSCCVVAAAFGPFLSRTAIMYGLRYIPASQMALVGLTTPVMTLLSALVVFGDVPTLRQLFGGAVMLAGIALPLLELHAHSTTVTSSRDRE